MVLNYSNHICLARNELPHLKCSPMKKDDLVERPGGCYHGEEDLITRRQQ